MRRRRQCRARLRVRVAWLTFAGLVLPLVVSASQREQDDLKRLSIEELMMIDVTTAGRRPEPAGATATAISVITGDDIRRMGARTIADALALADGVHVARFSTGSWRISARGFNGTTPNKLLVMIDGRTVYSPLFTGVFWNIVDYTLEDIERIEVIRGPGAVLWGANAVNGVINIITRHSRNTQGTLASVSLGNEDPATIEARFGSTAGTATWRVYGKFGVRDDQLFASGLPSRDGIRREQVGFRADSAAGGAAWMLTGALFHSRDEFPDRDTGEFSDGSLQGRWTRTLADTSRVDIQAYYRREYRRVPDQLTHRINTFDLDGQYATILGIRHNVVWGGGVRVNSDTTEGSAALRFDPEDRTYAVGSGFVQDEISILPGRLFSTLGVKYEHNAFSGGELQPNVRARVMLPENQMLWGAVSRAVRRPTRLDDDVVVPGPAGAVLVRGTHNFQAEKLTALELGYRAQPLATLSFEATAFHHMFDDLRSQDAPPGGGLPLMLGNTLDAQSTGLELGVNVQPWAWWRTHAGYTRLETEISRQPGSRDVGEGVSEANDPEHLLALRTSIDLPDHVATLLPHEVDASLRAVGALPNPRVPAYTELTVRLGWKATPRVDVWVVGHDLLDAAHPESGPDTPIRVEFERAVRMGVTIRLAP